MEAEEWEMGGIALEVVPHVPPLPTVSECLCAHCCLTTKHRHREHFDIFTIFNATLDFVSFSPNQSCNPKLYDNP